MKALLAKAWSAVGPWLHKVLSEPNGMPSSVRLIMFGWHVIVAMVWLTLCACHRQMVRIDDSVLAVLGIVSGGKIMQRFGEGDGCEKSPAA